MTAQMMSIMVPWMLAHWEEYHSGIMLYGNGYWGVTEANYLMVLLHLFTAAVGPGPRPQVALPVTAGHSSFVGLATWGSLLAACNVGGRSRGRYCWACLAVWWWHDCWQARVAVAVAKAQLSMRAVPENEQRVPPWEMQGCGS